MGRFRTTHTGYYGKLPARGDFVRAGLPEEFVAPLDLWCRDCLIASRAALGEGWEAAWMIAPVWHFLLPPGACGRYAALGVWMPSMDRVGRHYPFMLCALGESLGDLEDGAAWLAEAEAAGLDCVIDDAPADALVARLGAPVADQPVDGAGWWTTGSEHVTPRRRDSYALFPTPEAGAMLRDTSAAEF
jgi:type VI secretion system protein ImpM